MCDDVVTYTSICKKSASIYAVYIDSSYCYCSCSKCHY